MTTQEDKRPSTSIPTWHSIKQAAKKARLLDKADKVEQEGKAAGDAASRILDCIPLGQPILVGHHSERRHRSDLDRADRAMRKSVECDKRAQELRQKAHAVGTGGVSSDDPEAVQKLKSKLAELERTQSFRKKVNEAWRKAGKPAPDAGPVVWDKVGELAGIDLAAVRALRLDMARSWSWMPSAPFPNYSLSNLSSEIRRVRVRIDLLDRASQAVDSEVDHGVCRVIENTADNRIQLVFVGKPPQATRIMLKQSGFRWSPTSGAWQRHLNNAGRAAANYVVGVLLAAKAADHIEPKEEEG